MATKDITDEQIVRACIHAPDVFSLDVLIGATGAPRKVCERAMERAVGRGLINYGVSLRTAWAEPAGLALLAPHAVTFPPPRAGRWVVKERDEYGKAVRLYWEDEAAGA